MSPMFSAISKDGWSSYAGASVTTHTSSPRKTALMKTDRYEIILDEIHRYLLCS